MPTPIDVTKLALDGLRNLIDNHRRQNATQTLLYSNAVAELDRRLGSGLDFQKSYAVIMQAALKRKFVSYKELANASGADWSRVRYLVGPHLWRLVEYSSLRGWPMLSAIVVNKANINTGQMEPETLKGFIAAARALALDVGHDEPAFLKRQQEAVFQAAQTFIAEVSTKPAAV